MSRPTLVALSGLIILVASLLIVIWMLQRRLMYFPFGTVPSPEAVGLTRVERVTFMTADGLELQGWFLPGGAGRTRPLGVEPAVRFTVLVFNGNAGHRGFRAPLGAALQRHGLAVLLFDYRGFGGNPGAPTEAGLAADSRAARAYLLRRPDVDPSRLVYFGESLGSALAVDLAAEHPPAALILRSPFTSMADLGQLHYPFLPVRPFLRDRFASIDRIRSVRCPTLVIAGGRDSIVPLEQSRRLYAAAAGPRKQLLVLPDVDHNDEELVAGGEMIAAIVAFLEEMESV